MSKDQLLGALILVGAIAVLGVYGYMIYIESLRIWALLIVATVAVVGVMGVIAWIGWTLATTPAPTPLETFEEKTSSETATASGEKEKP